MSLMRDPGRARDNWGNEVIQQEFRAVLGRLGSDASPGAGGERSPAALPVAPGSAAGSVFWI
jgi:hypothetical protein